MAALFLSLVQTVARRSPDNRDAAFTLANGANGIAPIPLTPGAGLGGSVFAVDRNSGSGYAQQWNVGIQRAPTSNLAFEIAYAGSKVR